MAKVRVQDATKDLSTNAGRMLENISRLRRLVPGDAQFVAQNSDGFVREDHEKQEREAKEALQKQYEAAAQFMTAYSSEHAPEVPPTRLPKHRKRPGRKCPPRPHPRRGGVCRDRRTREGSVCRGAPAHGNGARCDSGIARREARKPPRQAARAKAAGAPAASQSPIRVVRTKAEVEASDEQRRRAMQQNRQQRPPQQPMPQQGAQFARPAAQPGQFARPAMPAGPVWASGQPAAARPGRMGVRSIRRSPGQGPYGRPVNPPQGGQGQFAGPAMPASSAPFPGGAPRPPQPGGARSAPEWTPRTGGTGFGRPKMPISPRGRKGARPATTTRTRSVCPPGRPRALADEQAPPPARHADHGRGMDEDFIAASARKGPDKVPPGADEDREGVMTAETIPVRDLTERIGKPAGDIIKKLMMLGHHRDHQQRARLPTRRNWCARVRRRPRDEAHRDRRGRA